MDINTDLKFRVVHEDNSEITFELDDNALDTIDITFVPASSGNLTITAFYKEKIIGGSLVVPVHPAPYIKILRFPPKSVELGTSVEIPLDTNVPIGSRCGLFAASVSEISTGEHQELSFHEKVLQFTPKSVGNFTVHLDLEEKSIEGKLRNFTSFTS